jgi:hypothetical protein
MPTKGKGRNSYCKKRTKDYSECGKKLIRARRMSWRSGYVYCPNSKNHKEEKRKI